LIASAKETNRTRRPAALQQVGQTLDPATGRAVLGPALGEVLPASAEGRLPARRPDGFRSALLPGGENRSSLGSAPGPRRPWGSRPFAVWAGPPNRERGGRLEEGNGRSEHGR